MKITGELVATVGHSVELIGAVWLFCGAWKTLRDPNAGSLGRSATPLDVGKAYVHAVKAVAKAGAGCGVVLIIIGLAVTTIGGWMQVARG